jgi:hypothetical protein
LTDKRQFLVMVLVLVTAGGCAADPPSGPWPWSCDIVRTCDEGSQDSVHGEIHEGWEADGGDVSSYLLGQCAARVEDLCPASLGECRVKCYPWKPAP